MQFLLHPTNAIIYRWLEKVQIILEIWFTKG